MKKTPVYLVHIGIQAVTYVSSSVTGGRSKCTYRIDAGEGKPAYAVDRRGHDHSFLYTGQLAGSILICRISYQ